MEITFLHTSESHVNRFTKIVQSLDKSVEVSHHVNEDLLSYAQHNGYLNTNGFKEIITKIRNDSNSIVICTCSTYGDLCNADEKTYRIDQPIGEYIVNKFTRIGIAFTVESTKQTSIRLIENLATQAQKSIQLFEIDCTPCWDWFLKGDHKNYEKEIADLIKGATTNCEVILLAQASMEGAKNYLCEEVYEVVSSPRYGVEQYLKLLK